MQKVLSLSPSNGARDDLYAFEVTKQSEGDLPFLFQKSF